MLTTIISTVLAVSVAASTPQTVPSTTFTPITFDCEDYDSAAMHSQLADTTHIVIPADGLYTIQGSSRFTGTIDGDLVGLQVVLVGVRVIKFQGERSRGYTIDRDIIVPPTLLAAGDVLELQAYHTHASDLPVGSTNASVASRLTVAEVGTVAGGLAVSGQSNAVAVAPYLGELQPASNVVSTGQGGQPIAAWDVGTGLWGDLARALRADQPRALVWWQGETDGLQATADFPARLADLMARVRALVPGLPVIVVQPVNEPELTGIRAALSAWVAGDTAAQLVSCDDLPRSRPSPVSYHLSAEGYAVVAARIQVALGS